jgi:GTP-binding nuclear protein Ran
MATTFKIVLIGAAGVGKSTWIKRQIFSDVFDSKYLATMGVGVHPVTLQVYGSRSTKITVEVWDVSGRLTGLTDGYYINADACIAMFDLTSQITFKDVQLQVKEVLRVAPNIPVVYIGNKADATDNIKFSSVKQLSSRYYDEMSVKTGYNLERPLLWVLRKLTNEPNLEIIDTALPARVTPVKFIAYCDECQMTVNARRLALEEYKYGVRCQCGTFIALCSVDEDPTKFRDQKVLVV